MNNNDKNIVRELAKKYADLAKLPVMQARIKRMRDNNDLIAGRPPVLINEIPWHEMNIDGRLDLKCEDEFARGFERYFKTVLLRWDYFRVDMVVEDFLTVYKSCRDESVQLLTDEKTLRTDSENNICSHEYNDVLSTEADLEKITEPKLTADKALDALNVEKTQDLTGGILPVKLRGSYVYHSPWDTIASLRGAEKLLFDLAVRPEFMHKIIDRFTNNALSALKQKERLGLLDSDIPDLHCTPPYASDFSSGEENRTKADNIWIRGTAQLFSSVSPDMHEEFELEYARKLYEKCKLVYYGCCEPLDNKIGLLKKIPNLRKIGVSPWADEEKCAEQTGGAYVYARKPNPSHVAAVTDIEVVKKETRKTVEICRKYGCPYEFVLKDISTVGRKPQNLIAWAKAVTEVIDEYY